MPAASASSDQEPRLLCIEPTGDDRLDGTLVVDLDLLLVDRVDVADRGHRYGHGGEAKGRAMSVVGRWRIVGTELWDPEALDLVAPAFIEFGEDGMGRFGFIAVEGWMDCRHGERDGRSVVEFSWDGRDDCNPASGRGWAALQEDGLLRGRIYFHLGDDSGFRAVRADEESSDDATDASGGKLEPR